MRLISLKFMLFASALQLLGCASLGGVQRADTLGKGNYQVGIEPGAAALVVPGTQPLMFPVVDVSARFGVTDGIDLGARVGTGTGLEVQGKFLLTKPGDPNLAVSFAPTFGGFAIGVGGAAVALLGLNLPVLVGIKLGEHELILGPRLYSWYFGGGGGGQSAGGLVLMPGMSVGFAAQLSDSFALIPELSFVVPVGAAAGVSQALGGGSAASSINAFAPFMSFRLGIEFGRMGKRAPPEPIEPLTPPPPPAI